MNKEVAGRPGPRACRRHGARRLIICAARPGKSLTARARRRLSGGNLTVDAARYVPSSSSKNKRATSLPPAPLHRTTAAAATKSGVGASGVGGRRRASAATVVGCGTSTAASAPRWQVLGRIVRIVSAARRAQGTHRIRESISIATSSIHTRALSVFWRSSPRFAKLSSVLQDAMIILQRAGFAPESLS